MKNLAEYTILETKTLMDAAHKINQNHTRAIVVVNERNKVVGMLSEGDILRALLHGADIHTKLSCFITHGFKYLLSKDYKHALEIIRQHTISLIPILDNEFQLIDVITIQELWEKVNLEHHDGR